MKTIFTLMCISLLAVTVSATVTTVSNNSSSPGQFTDLQTAIDAATNGDTIYVHGSPTSYGDIHLNRSLTLIGPGYNPQKDLPLTANINVLMLDSVAGIKGCSNSNIIGMTMVYLQNTGAPFRFDNILITLNRITQVNLAPVLSTNIIFSQNVIDHFYSLNYVNNVIIRNNIIYNATSYFANCQSVLITNNLYFYVSPSTNFVIQDFTTIANNIFLNLHPNTNFSTFNNNLIFNSGNDVLPYGNNTGSGNFNGQAPIFVNDGGGNYNGINLSYDYHLTAGSPGHNGGTDGTDIGPFGGIDPMMDLTGTPPVPQIKVFNITNTVVLPNTPLDIYVKAKKQ
jgi:hypothetical protein